MNDQLIVKICQILSELKKHWKSLWFNKNDIELEFEESNSLKKIVFHNSSSNEQGMLFYKKKS